MTVTVVGGGLAGAVAAVAASRHRDVDVRLLTAGETSLQAASGLVDVLGYTPGGEGPLADPFAAIPRLPEGHPYRTVGVDAVRAGLELFDDVAGERYVGDGSDRNALVPTPLGNLKPTARYPASVAPGVASRRQRTTLVGFERFTAVDAPLAGDRLDGQLPYPAWGTTVEFPAEVGGSPDATDLAVALEAEYERDGAAGAAERFRDALAREVVIYDETDRRIGVPAVLGLDSTTELRARLAEAVEAPVFEVPTGPPSVPGARLETLFRDALEAAGVDVSTDTRVTGATTEGSRVVTLEVDGAAEAVETDAAVLATGGVAGGGIEGARDGVAERVFDCHVPHPDDRSGWSAEEPLGDHGFAAFGVDTDGHLRPLDARGSPAYANLRAAGSVLGGHDFASEKSGSGVSIATGYVAGRLAAEDAS